MCDKKGNLRRQIEASIGDRRRIGGNQKAAGDVQLPEKWLGLMVEGGNGSI